MYSMSCQSFVDISFAVAELSPSIQMTLASPPNICNEPGGWVFNNQINNQRSIHRFTVKL